MSKAIKTDKIQGPKGEVLVVSWMNDDRVQIGFSRKVAVSSFFPGSNINPKPKIVIQPI